MSLVTTRFAHGSVPAPEGYDVRHAFYRRSGGAFGRRAARAVQHVADMRRYARATDADVVHFQWIAVQQADGWLLPRGRALVLTAHDVLPREAGPGQRAGQKRLYSLMDAVIVHSEHGARRLIEEVGVAPERVHVIPHGAFHHLAALTPSLPPELPRDGPPVVLFFGLLRPYKGLDVLLDAWRDVDGAELWVVGKSRMPVPRLPPGVRRVDRFVSDAEAAAVFRRATVAVLPYREIDQSGVLFSALAFGLPLVLTAVGGFPEVAATGAARLVAPVDATGLADALREVLADPAPLAAAARAAAAPGGPYGWDAIARRTLALYSSLQA